MSEQTFGTVAQIIRYPVKSMLGESLPTGEITPRGLPLDRGLAFVDLDTGKIVSAKYPAKWRAMLSAQAHLNGEVKITLPGGRVVGVTDPSLDAVISDLVGRPVRLVESRNDGDTVERAIPEEVMADGLGADVEFTLLELAEKAPGDAFADYAPLHLITTATLAATGAAGGAAPVDAIRYRPNIVIDSGDAEGFVENDWVGRRVLIGDEVELEIVLPTPRCAIPTLAHGDLPPDHTPVRALLEANRIPVEGFGVLPAAGVYAEVIRPGRITLRDRVTVTG
ncbi:MAG: MOSC N-terminal beta barrel domain-containing protein [Nocardioides sp.]